MSGIGISGAIGGDSKKNGRRDSASLTRCFRNSRSRLPGSEIDRQELPAADLLVSAAHNQRCSSSDWLRLPRIDEQTFQPVRHSCSGFKVSQITATEAEFTEITYSLQHIFFWKNLFTEFSQLIRQERKKLTK